MVPKPVVLLVHGMGNHTDASVKEEFKDGLKQCMEFLGQSDFDANDAFTIKTFNYSEYWDDKRKAFAEHLEGDIKDALSLTPNLIQKIVNMTSELDGDDFLYTHVLDVLFYLTGGLRSHQLIKLHKMIGDEIEASVNNLNGQRVIVVAHSLGTAFVHDCLTQLYTQRLDPINFGLDQLWSVATVSRMTHMITRMDDPTTSIVTDHSPIKAGVCKEFYPVYNDFDPFCWFKRYTRAPHEGMLINTKHVRDLHQIYSQPSDIMRFNPHDLREYFADPEVGARFLSSNNIIDINFNDFIAAQAKYRSTTATGLLSDSYKAIQSQLEALGETADSFTGMRKKVEILSEVYKLIDEIRDEFKL
ncbi:hypothetical protein R3X26_09405 [Vibrio sp. TH_r3]|uniref:hypothetical protein n=1 Tax=Vibrio sp. TH_r3 TaxID=3082084 RepID=UPI002953622E|nr:hypothetical protein [Vibrio sp. TH_r3]MDV7104610.1 hypothetical protein [Vibrio sp. TH_r3]